jgi:hypothetical protein
MAEEQVVKKERGVLLTILLVLGAIGILASLFTIFNTSLLLQTYGTLPNWYIPYMIAGFALGVVNLFGVWKWKKWVIYTLAVSSLVGIIMQVFFLKPVNTTTGPMPIIHSLLSTGLWFFAIYRKWRFFE